MYTRQADGREIELGVSGMLYKDALVMFDRATETLWTQVDGSALRGPLLGHRLEHVPAMQTTWKVWKKLHPDTLVLRKPRRVRGSAYEDYFSDPSRRGLNGTRGGSQLAGKTMIIGVEANLDAAAVPLPALKKDPLRHIAVGRERLVVLYLKSLETAVVYRAGLEGRILSFRIRGKGHSLFLEDLETRSRWLPLQGRAVAGPLKGKRLEPYAHLHSYWYAWSAYRPNTRVIK